MQEQQEKVFLFPDRIVSSVELFEELKKVEPQKAFNTGYYHLDSMTKGFKEGDLVVLSGLTGSGKTEVSVSIAKKFIGQELYPLFFSYEISSQELFERFGEPIPLFYLPRVVSGFQDPTRWIEQKIIEAKKLADIKIVFIDHLHYLVDYATTRNKNTAEMLGYMCREFKHIARRQRVVIFLIAHVRKFQTSRPYLQDIKDSSGIIQEADTVFIIHRTGKRRNRKVENTDEEYEIDNSATLYIDKVRRRGGRIGKIALTFENGFFVEN